MFGIEWNETESVEKKKTNEHLTSADFVNEILSTTLKKRKRSEKNNESENLVESASKDLSKPTKNVSKLKENLTKSTKNITNLTENVSKTSSSKALKESVSKSSKKKKSSLEGSQFRILNDLLYNSNSVDSFHQFQLNSDLFHSYHSGFKSQVENWPLNPLDCYIHDLTKFLETTNIKKRTLFSSTSSISTDKPSPFFVVDMGCGEAKLAESLVKHQLNNPNSLYKINIQSFDLVKPIDNPYITAACNIKNVPVKSNYVDLVIFCLSLMGTDWFRFILEARRILKIR